MSAELVARVQELEIKVSFAEDLLDEVNRTLWRQQQLVEQLQREVRALRAQLGDAPGGTSGLSLRDELPPHY